MRKSPDGPAPASRAGRRGHSRSRSRGPLIVVYHGRSLSLDLHIDRPDPWLKAVAPRFIEMVKGIAMTDGKPPAVMSSSGNGAPDPSYDLGKARRDLVASSGFADFVIDEMGKLFTSEDDLMRMQIAIQRELTRRQETQS